jgi:uncharacterized protein YjeT (DUF2065 family)
MLIIAKFTVIAFGLFIILCGLLMLFAPKRANDYLRKFGSTNFINYAELVIRILIGIAMIFASDISKFPDIFRIFGWFMVITGLILCCVPRRIHHNFSLNAAETLNPFYFQMISPFSFLFGAVIIYSFL